MSRSSRPLVDERGNALFLILIAVILFGALSYAISRSNLGGTEATREVNQIGTSVIEQYVASIGAGVTRMTLYGADVTEILFNPPGSFSGTTAREIFHADGGGVSWQNPDPKLVDVDNNGLPLGAWEFDNNVLLGSGTHLVVYLTRVRQKICQQINERQTGSTAIPVINDTIANIIASQDLSSLGMAPALCVGATGHTPTQYLFFSSLSQRS
jgi:hypothetical protein